MKLKFKGGDIPFEFGIGTSENALVDKLSGELEQIMSTAEDIVNRQ